MIATERYFGLGFCSGGRERPAVDCWGLYRLIVGEATGVWLAPFAGTEDMRAAARAAREAAGDGASWHPVRPGEERPLDAVLMRGLVRDGRRAHAAPTHVGCVIGTGRMIDISEAGGVRVQVFRTTAKATARPEVANGVIGIFRPEALA